MEVNIYEKGYEENYKSRIQKNCFHSRAIGIIAENFYQRKFLAT